MPNKRAIILNLDLLINKVAEFLGVSVSEKEFAFKMFVNQVAENLNVNEAFKIKDFGLFQLKRDASDQSRTPRNVLIFSPFTEKLSRETRALYITIDVNLPNRTTVEFDENIFNLGVNKPVIPLYDNDRYQSDSYSILRRLIENKIGDLIGDSERIKNFNIVGDYLSNTGSNRQNRITKETPTNAFEKLSEELPAPKLTPFDRFTSEEDVHGKENTYTTINFEEKETDVEPEEQSINEEVPEEDSLPEPDNAFEDLLRQSFEDTEDISDEEKEVSSRVVELPLDDEEENVKSEEEKIEWDWGDELKEEFLSEGDFVEETKETITDVKEEGGVDLFEQLKKSYSDDLETDTVHDKEAGEPEEENVIRQTVHNSPANESADLKGSDKKMSEQKTLPQPPEKFNSNKKGRFGKLFWIVLASFVLITAAGIYYFFFMKDNIIKKENLAAQDTLIYNQQTNNQPVISTEEQAPDLSTEADSLLAEQSTANDSVLAKKPDENKTSETKISDTKPAETKVTPKPPEETGLIRSAANEKQVANLIFSNGKKFNVQVSSWKQKSKAENEVNRLKALGYDAFIVEAYLPNLGGTWYRVRIGYFNTSKEATDFLQKRNF